MKFTSKDLMKAMGLQVGDRVEVGSLVGIIKNDSEDNKITVELYNENKWYGTDFLYKLVDKEIEILPRPKRVGDLKCDKECNTCPLKILCRADMINSENVATLYILLEPFKDRDYFDQEIYDLLKARLDKEVEEE